MPMKIPIFFQSNEIMMKEVIPAGFSLENKTENTFEESNQFGELRLQKKGQLKHKNPKVIRYRHIQLGKIESKLKRIFIPIFDRD